MRKFLAIGLVVLMGIILVGISDAYASDTKNETEATKKSQRDFYAYFNYGGTSTNFRDSLEEKEQGAWFLGLIVFNHPYFQKPWNIFWETQIGFYSPLEFSVSLNTMAWLLRSFKRDREGKKTLSSGINIFGGLGVSNIRTVQGGYSGYIARIGIRLCFKVGLSINLEWGTYLGKKKYPYYSHFSFGGWK